MPQSTFYFNPLALISFSSFLIMIVLAFLLWQRYYTNQTKFVVLLFLANAVYSFFYSFEISFKTIEEITWFYRCEYLGIPFLSTFYLIFALHFSGREKWLNLRNYLLILFIPLTSLVLVFTNENHHLFYVQAHMSSTGPFPAFAFTPAVWYFIQQGYVILTMLFALIILGIVLRNSTSIYRRQIFFLLLATTFPFAGYLAYQMHLVPFGIDPVSFTFTLTGIFVYIALVRFKLFELVPIARTKLFEKIQERVLVFDLHDRLIDFNQSASTQYKLSNKDLGKGIPDALTNWPEMLYFIRHNQSGKIELHRLEEGVLNFFDIQILELEDSDNIRQGKLVVIKDVTDIINNERDRIYTASKLNAVLHAMPDIILIIDNKGFLTDFFASETENLFLNKEEVIGASLSHLFNPDEEVILKGLLADCLKTNELITHQLEMNFPGEVRHYEARLSKIDDFHVLAIIRDVSESFDMKQDLLYQSGFQKILMNLASLFIYIAESETDAVISDSLRQIGEYTGVDRAYVCRYDAENDTMTNTHEWCSEGISPLIGMRQQLPVHLLAGVVAKHKQGEPTSHSHLTKLDSKHPARKLIGEDKVQSILTIPMISQKNCLGFVGFDTINPSKKWNNSDISLLKIFTGMLANLQEKITIEKSLVEARIKAEASNRLKTAFMNNISHEIRTPLNGIIGFGEIIANEQLSLEEKNKFLTVVQESSERLIHTIDNYLDISMLVTGNLEIHSTRFNVAQMIQELVDDLNQNTHSNNLSIQAVIPEEAKQTTLYADAELLRKALSHLAGNAIKFTDQGNIFIGMEPNDGKLDLYVQDTGIGIAANAQKYVFDSFMQEDFSSTRMYEGSGLGLSIVKGIVNLLGGDISVSSTKGKGSKFNITLPIS